MPTDPLDLDAYAFGIQERIDNEIDGPDGRKQLSLVLDDYKRRVRSEGREPFSHYLKQRAEQDQRVMSLFSSPDVPGLPEGYTGPDKQAHRQRTAGIAYLSHISGRSTDDVAMLFPALRSAWAKQHLGKDELSEGEFFNQLAANQKLQGAIKQSVAQAAMAGQSPAQAWQALSETHKDKPGWFKSQEREYAKSVYLATHTLNAKLAPYRGIISSVVTDTQSMMGVTEGESTGANWKSLADRLLSVPKEDRDLVLQAIVTGGAGDQDAKGVIQKIGENLWRGATDLGEGVPLAMKRSRLLDVQKRINNDDLGVPAVWEPDKVFRLLMQGADDGVTRLPIDRRGERRKLTDEEKKSLNEQVSRTLDVADMIRTAEDIAEGVVDPASSSNVIAVGLYGMARSAPQFAAAVSPYGWAAIAGQFAEDNYHQIRREQPDLPREAANSIALWTAPGQALVETVSDRFLMGRLPNALKLFKTPATTWATQAKRLPWLLPKAGAEYTEEVIQDFAPYATQQLAAALKLDVPEAPWDKALSGFKEGHAEMVSTVIWMTLVGHGAGSVMDMGQNRFQAKDPALLEMAGFKGDYLKTIPDAANAGDWRKVEELMRQAVKSGEVETDGGKLVVKREAAAAIIRQRAQTKQSAERELEQLGAIPVMGRDQQTGGWYVREKDGGQMPFPTHEEANAARWDQVEEMNIGIHGAIREALEADERKLQPGEETAPRFTFREVTLAQQKAESPGDAQTLERRQKQADVLDDGFEREAYIAANAVNTATAPNAESQDAVDLIIGKSYTEFADGIRRRVMELNQGATPLTIIEESVEDDARKLLGSGRRDWLLSNLRELERKMGEKLFITENDADVQSSDLVEAYSHIATSYFAGKSRKGEGKFRNNKGWLDQFRADLRTMGIKRLLDATATKLYAMFRRAAKLGRLSQKGQINPDFEAQLAQSLGLSQAVHEAQVIKEAAEQAAEMVERMAAEGMELSAENAAFSMQRGAKSPPSLLAQDQDYLAAVERGDMETAQRMVDARLADIGAYWHGTPSGDLRGGSTGLHIGTRQSAVEALEARIGIPADGRGWDGTREYGETLLAGRDRVASGQFGKYRDTGYNSDSPREDFYARDHKLPTVGKGVPVDPKWKPWIRPVLIVGQMSKRKKTDSAANSSMARLIAKGEAREGFFYKNEAEDVGSVSAVLPDGSFVRVKSADPVTRDDQGNVIPLSQRFNPAKDSISFSLSSGTLDQRLAKMFDPFQKSPELRQKVGLLAQQRVGKFAREWENASQQDKRIKDIDEERRAKQDQLFVEKMQAAGVVPELSEVNDHPLLKEVWGRAMPFKEGQRRGIANEYDDAPPLPRDFYKGSRAPDQLAQELHDGGLLPDAFPATMWKAVEQAYAAVSRNAAGVKKAAQDARTEAKAWADAEKKKSASPGTSRARLLAALRTLDAILSTVPAEVRGKIGGYIQLAKLSTDEARIAEIESRVKRMDKELEKWLRGEFTGAIDKALEKYTSQRSDSGQMKGKLVASYTDQVDYADAFRKLSTEDQDKEFAALEKTIEESDDADKIQDAMNKMGIAELFYDSGEQDAATLSRAKEWLDETIQKGKDAKAVLDEARKAYVAEMKSEASNDVLDGGDASLVEAENVEASVKKSWWKKVFDNTKGFIHSSLWTSAQQLERVFGEGSKVTEHFTRRIWEAANLETDIKRDIDRQRTEAVRRIFGTSNTFTLTSKMARMQEVRKSGVMVTKGRKTESVTLTLDILQRLSDGAITPESIGLNETQAKMALDAWAAGKRTTTATIEKVKHGGREVELVMSEMDAVQYKLGWNQAEVRARMEKHGWSEGSIQQINAFLSPEAEAFGQWMSETYEQGAAMIDPVYRRIFNAPLPRVKNYAPTHYNISKQDNATSLDQQQLSSGLTAGFTKARRAHGAELRRTDALAAFLQHWDHVAHWVAYAELVRDMKAVLTDTQVQDAIRTKAGVQEAQGLKNRIKSIESNGNTQAWTLSAMDGFMTRMNQWRAFKGLAFRLSPVVKQTSALLNPLLADVPIHSYMVGLAKLMMGRIDVSAVWKSEAIRRRIEMGFSPEARLGIETASHNTGSPIGAVLLSMMQKGMLPMQYTDAAWTSAGSAVAFDFYKSRLLKDGATEAAAEAEALRAVERMIAMTAQPADAVNRSLSEADSNVYKRALWMFASESRKMLAIELHSMGKLLTGKSKNKAMDVQRVVVAHFMAASVTQLMSAMLASLVGDDDDAEREWSLEQWGAALVAGPVNGLFLFGDAINYAVRRTFGLRVFGSSSPAMKMMEDSISAVNNADNLLDDDPEKQLEAFLKLTSSAGALASAAGVPVVGAADVILGNPAKEALKLTSGARD